MSQQRLLLLSNSTNAGQGYLAHARPVIAEFLGPSVSSVLFVPFAGVRFSYGSYAGRVGDVFDAIGYRLTSIHAVDDPKGAVEDAEAIAVGGGNTFHLLRGMYGAGIMERIRRRVGEGMPYIGWSAGSNVACPTICTTNDMPIVEPPTFRALDLVPFQINPHYTDAHPPGHQGETRAERIQEFVIANPGTTVVGLPEGTWLRVEGGEVAYHGEKAACVFRQGEEVARYTGEKSLQFLLQNA